MLQHISGTAFIESILFLTAIYYAVIAVVYYPKEIGQWIKKQTMKKYFLLIAATISAQYLKAQTADGNNGISQANTMIRGYYDTATQLMYGVGALLALIGAVRVYMLWGAPHGEASRAAAGWFGSCIFLVVVSTIIRSFFGL